VLFYGRVRAFVQSTRTQGPASVVVGAILGERRQLTSKEVSIDVRRITLRGEARTQNFRVHYTIDGSLPSLDSLIYNGPFTVQIGTTVRAVVIEDNEPLFEMQERFARNVGLHWGSPEKSDPDVVEVSHKRAAVESAARGGQRRLNYRNRVSEDSDDPAREGHNQKRETANNR